MATERQLEIFIAVVETGGIRQAADALGISQPSISRQLRALERSVGGELLLRKRGLRAQVSKLGVSLLPDARDSLDQHRRLRRSARTENLVPPVIYVRAFLLAQIKERLSELHDRGLPRSVRFVVVDDHQDMAELVERESRSAAIFRTDNIAFSPQISAKIVRSETGSLYSSPGIAERLRSGEIGLDDIDILYPCEHPGLRTYTARLLERAGKGSAIIKQGPQFIEHLIEDIVQERGIAVLFDDTVKDLVNKNSLEKLFELSQPYYFVLLANKALRDSELVRIETAFFSIID